MGFEDFLEDDGVEFDGTDSALTGMGSNAKSSHASIVSDEETFGAFGSPTAAACCNCLRLRIKDVNSSRSVWMISRSICPGFLRRCRIFARNFNLRYRIRV